jgi:hypothetical protein
MCNHYLGFEDLLDVFPSHFIIVLCFVIIQCLYHNLLASPKRLNDFIQLTDEKNIAIL